ncbi:peptidylprolyl isomerase [Paenibacillus sacheonensis]|uniref:Peptidyl-prolyl cis-trans isomerase n=1 Tax=Paenibacillus sacheonensis TaxID=742054 RepID=A0A7X4YLZ1_9BACL|nr:peptidylprolyl isomerase [Paenibacillus sacheonensis]MBM7563384.1 cyclophilin family peptidyl-prolyl cis-trans isomerase [Paenibacillus sacheonensis]NBC68061.1 peptidylprolyl isomerase [Paenibacillus sacheonensis]
MNMKNRTALTVVLSAMLLVASACGTKPENAAQNQGSTNTQTETSASGGTNSENDADGEAGTSKQWSEKPKMAIDTSKSYSAVFKTNKGDFTVELYAKDRPETVNNFVFLSKEKFYDGVKFHRIIQSFMIQGGDPTGTGGGGPGYTIPDELDSKYKYEEGVLAMAKTSAPNSGGSQFFICSGADAAGLNNTPDYTIFGKVTAGMDVVKAIAATPVEMDASGREASVPTEDVVINTIAIEEK